jgi:hypothetical protein
MSILFEPKAKYGDSIIVQNGFELKECLINEVKGMFDEKENLFWIYYLNSKSGIINSIDDEDILMNLTTGQVFEKEITINKYEYPKL